MKNEIQKYEKSELSKLKDYMYDILEVDLDSNKDETNIVANQEMGVQISNSMKKQELT